MDKYVQLLSKFEKQQKEKSDELYKVNQEIRGYAREKAAFEAKIETMTRQIADTEKAYQLMISSYEERIARLQKQVTQERDEKMELLAEITKLQVTLEDIETRNAEDSGLLAAQAQITQLKIQLSKTNADLDAARTELLNRELFETNLQKEREDEAKSIRRVREHNRIEFIGTPKSFQEIIAIIELIDRKKLHDKDQITALEEIIIFCKESPDNLLKVRRYKGHNHAVKALKTDDSYTLMRILALLAVLTQADQQTMQEAVEQGVMTHLKKCLLDINKYTRVEAIALLGNLLEYEPARGMAAELVQPVTVLLDEVMHSPTENEQTIQLLLRCLYYMSVNDVCRNQIRMQGGLRQIRACLELPQPHIAIDAVQELCADKDCRTDLANNGVIPVLLSLLQNNVAPLSVATALASCCLTDEIKAVVRREGLIILI